VIGGEELNQLSESKLEKLEGSLRTSKEGWRPRLYGSFNPGGIGHGYVKSTFVQPWKEGIDHRTRFIPAQYTANKFINDEYRDYLAGLKGQLAQCPISMTPISSKLATSCAFCDQMLRTSGAPSRGPESPLIVMTAESG
jgi:hypothetical protein